MAFDDSWPLFGASETMYPIFTGQIKISLVDRKPLLAGALIHRFDCILRIVQTCTFDRLTACVHSAFEEEVNVRLQCSNKGGFHKTNLSRCI